MQMQRMWLQTASWHTRLHIGKGYWWNYASLIGGIRLTDIMEKYLSDGKIIGIYKECYCNIPKQIANLHKGYCECSAGWYTRLFLRFLAKV